LVVFSGCLFQRFVAGTLYVTEIKMNHDAF